MVWWLSRTLFIASRCKFFFFFLTTKRKAFSLHHVLPNAVQFPNGTSSDYLPEYSQYTIGRKTPPSHNVYIFFHLFYFCAWIAMEKKNLSTLMDQATTLSSCLCLYRCGMAVLRRMQCICGPAVVGKVLGDFSWWLIEELCGFYLSSGSHPAPPYLAMKKSKIFKENYR